MNAVKEDKLNDFEVICKKDINRFSVTYCGYEVQSTNAKDFAEKLNQNDHNKPYYITENDSVIRKHIIVIHFRDDYVKFFKKTKEGIESIVSDITSGDLEWIKIENDGK